MHLHPFWTYSREVLSFRWPGRERPPALQPPPKGERDRALHDALRRLGRGGQRHVLLFGLGSGVMAEDLAATLPADIGLTVCDASPARVQAVFDAHPGRMVWWRPDGNRQLLVDDSPWALRLLLAGYGPPLGDTLRLSAPEPDPDGVHARLRRWHENLALASFPGGNAPASLSAAAILRPDEPGLDEFLAQFPDWLHEIVVVWDAESVPRHGLTAAAPFRESARPLGGDFAAQRNAMLAACTGDWVMVLDGDERLTSKGWESLPGLLGGDVDGLCFPRMTPWPDEAHCLAGLGLWPDLQLRLFRRAPGLRYVGAVHERLRGLQGPTAALCAIPILHYGHLRKDGGQWAEKLALYDEAAAGGVRHRRNADYPSLDMAFFIGLIGAFPTDAALLMD